MDLLRATGQHPSFLWDQFPLPRVSEPGREIPCGCGNTEDVSNHIIDRSGARDRGSEVQAEHRRSGPRVESQGPARDPLEHGLEAFAEVPDHCLLAGMPSRDLVAAKRPSPLPRAVKRVVPAATAE